MTVLFSFTCMVTSSPPPAQEKAEQRSATLQDSERQHILRTLERVGWRIYGPLGAATELGINPSTLRSRMKKLGLSRPTYTPP